MAKARIVHYMNQFYAGAGGEEQADMQVGSRAGAVGPGVGLQKELGDWAEIVATVWCGDNFFGEHPQEAKAQALVEVRKYKPDLVVAGPAFTAGRYGYACMEVCQGASTELGIKCVAGLNLENPGVDTYKVYKNLSVFAIPVTATAAGMGEALKKMGGLALKVASGAPIGPAADEGYIGHGIRQEIRVEKRGSLRALDMLEARLEGVPYVSEIPIYVYDRVPAPEPLKNLTKAAIAVATTSGLSPAGNPDKFRSNDNSVWKKYSIAGLSSMEKGKWQAIHGGYNTVFMNDNPNFGLPLDVLREMEDAGQIGTLYDYAYCLTGNGAQVANARRMGEEMAQDMKASKIDGVILVST